MKKIMLIAVLTLLTLGSASQVKLYDGEEIDAENITMKKSEFKVDKKKIHRGDIREIVFTKAQEATTETQESSEMYDIEELKRIAAELETKYTDAAGLILIDHGNTTIRSDGTNKYHYHFAGKIIKPSRLYWGQRGLFIDEGRSTARILWARTILPDGRILFADTSKATISPVTRGGAFFGYGSIYALEFSGVQEGAIIEYVYETEEYNPDDTTSFPFRWYFQGEDDPVYSSVYSIRVPKGKDIYYFFKNPIGALGSALYKTNPKLMENCFFEYDVEMEGFAKDEVVLADTNPSRWDEHSREAMKIASPKVTDEDTSVLYTWKLMNVEPYLDEPSMPSYADVTPYLYGNVLPDWEHLFDWLGGFQKARIEITPRIEEKTSEIVKDAKTIEEKIDLIYRWVQRNIRYISIKGSVSSGQTGHRADETWENGFGDCTDKSILFCTMLKVVGVEAHPIILMVNHSQEINRCIPQTSGNHAITRVKLPDGKWIFLDATNLTFKYPYRTSEDQGVTFVDCIGREVGMIPTNTPKEYSQRTVVKMELEPNGDATAEFSSIPYGMMEAGWRAFWETQQKERLPIIFNGWLNNIFPKATLDTFALVGLADMDTQLHGWAKVNVLSFPSEAGDMWVLNIPGVMYSMQGFDEVNLKERTYDIEYSCPTQEEHEITIELPKGAKIIGLPEDVELSFKDYADFYLKFEKKKDEIIVRERYRLKQRIIPFYEYEGFKDFIISAKQATEKRIFVANPNIKS